MTGRLPQPHEGIRGTNMNHWLLSLDERAVVHRECLIALAHHLSAAVLVGNPAPVVRRMNARMHQPVPGDLAVATEILHGRRDPDDRIKGLGILLGRRLEWAETDAEWAALLETEPYFADEDRTTETAYYLQYGPAAGNVCRWVNSEPVALLTQPWPFGQDGAASREETPDGRISTVFTRDSLLGALEDSGFRLRLPPRAEA